MRTRILHVPSSPGTKWWVLEGRYSEVINAAICRCSSRADAVLVSTILNQASAEQWRAALEKAANGQKKSHASV